MFNLVLAQYSIDQIEQAFVFYLKRNNEMPAPADIANIIERGNRPPLERAVYGALSRKSPEERSPDEWRYIREYESFAMRGDQ